MKIRYSITGLSLIVALAAGLAPARISAGNGGGADQQKPIRLYASARFGPIGAINLNSLSGAAVAIDGRIVQGEAPIWGGELIKAIADRPVRVALDSIGQVTLARGAMARFASARASADVAGYDVLVASIVAGSVAVKLNAAAGAYIVAGWSVITASRGSSFSVSIEDGRASLSTTAGNVRVQDQAAPQDVNIRLVDDLGRPVSSGSQFSVRARSTRQVQVQVTDKNDKPLPDLPVLFSLGDPCIGSLGLGAAAGLTMVQKTDKRGIAAAPLVAGAARCAASIIAKVEGTNASVTIQTNVQPQARFFNTQNNLIMLGGAAVTALVIGLVVSNSDSSEPIKPVTPPGIQP